MTKNPSKVAAYLTRHIDASEKSQIQIAQEAGFARPNLITMLKTGVTKLPVARIVSMAKAIDADPAELFRLAMNEYMPEFLDVCDEIYGRDKINSGETELLKRLRVTTGGKSFRLNADANKAIDELGASLVGK